MGPTAESEPSLSARLRDHVLSPLETAETAVAQEVDQVTAEQAALDAFGSRVAGVQPVSTGEERPAIRRRTTVKSAKPVRRARNAFHETVMDLDHYEATYGETMEEFVAAELSAALAAPLRVETGAAFTEFAKSRLLSAVERSGEQREEFLGVLANERDSLDQAAERLESVCAQVRSGQVPDCTRLDETARQRQRTIRRSVPAVRTDGHDLCTYLYADAPWTYPVLTAVARFRRSIPG